MRARTFLKGPMRRADKLVIVVRSDMPLSMSVRRRSRPSLVLPVVLVRIPFAVALVCIATTVRAADSEAALAELGLEDLMKIEITSVSRRPQRLSDTAAAISVLTADDIRRSGAASIPDALRLVPGVDVARINGTYQAVSVRGFNNGFAMKLLVLVDGRSVYSPLFSGTFWDAQDTMIEDIERIEVIRGPGAAIWGSNAVNGVINIITKRAADTQGGLAVAIYGPYERRAGVRYGSTSTDGTAWRLFANATERDDTVLPTGQTGGTVRQERVGLRADRAIGARDQISVHGEAYHGSSGAPATVLPIESPLGVASLSTDSQPRGGHFMTRWEHGLEGGSTVITEAYFDRTERSRSIGLKDSVDTWDLALQHTIPLHGRHRITWGGGYRTYRYQVPFNYQLQLTPSIGNEELLNLFAQDEIVIVPDRLRLTLGMRLERSSLVGGVNPQPDARLAWNIDERQMLWGGISRANRLPSLIERGASVRTSFTPAAPPFVPLPIVGGVTGSNTLVPEQLTAWQIGYRHLVTSDFSLDVTTFVHDYKRAILPNRNATCTPDAFPPTYLGCNVTFDNGGTAHAKGFEVSAEWRPSPQWRMQANYSYADVEVRHPGSAAALSNSSLSGGASPRHQGSLHVSGDLTDRIQTDLTVRYVDTLTAFATPAYTAVDARIGWRPVPKLELSLIGRNLTDGRHIEFGMDPFFTPAEVRRSVLVKAVLEF